jgi:glycosyltransferase involved in cell wall biosynthesis
MRIAVDGRHLAAGRGVARYSARLLDALRAIPPADDWRVVQRRGKSAYLSAAVLGRPRLDVLAGGADVVWLPAPAPVAVSSGVPYVLTVHDLSWLARPEDFSLYERWWHRLAHVPRLVRGAAAVIAVSSATRDAVISAGWASDGRVRVVRSGPGLGPPPAAGVSHVVPDNPGQRAGPPYFVVVGRREPRKEPEVAERAHAAARASGLRAELVFAAGASDEELRALYSGALAVVHPAHLEGFGFPPIEGLAHGTPAIVADLPDYDETIAGGALRFPVGDDRALADSMLRIERDPDLRARLVRDGRAKIAELSWERAAQQTHAILTEAAAR